MRMNPWLSIWTKPKETIRSILNYRVNYGLFFLCWAFGFFSLGFVSVGLSETRGMTLSVLIWMAILLGFPVGYLLVNFSSFWIYLIGRLLKGKARFKEVRAVHCWSFVPNILSAIIWTLAYLSMSFTPLADIVPEAPADNLMGFMSWSLFWCAIWAFIIFVKGLKIVQGFSGWKILLNIIGSFILSSVVVYLLLVIIGQFSS